MLIEVEQLKGIELSANFNPRERQYFYKLRDELEAIVGGVSIEKLDKPTDVVHARRIRAKLEEILKFVQERRIETDVVLRELFLNWAREFHLDGWITPEWVSQNADFYDNKIFIHDDFSFLGKAKDITSLPDNLHCDLGLFLQGSGLKFLPDGLWVGDSLLLQGSENLEALSSGLYVGGSLRFTGCPKLKSLPPGLFVGRELYVNAATSLVEIPDDLHVGGDFSMKYCSALKYLPRDLTVGGSLNLQGCTSLATLNEGLHVGGDLNLGFVIATDLPKDFFVGGNVSAYSVPPELLAKLQKAKKQGKILGNIES